jgi:hypothetical protein
MKKVDFGVVFAVLMAVLLAIGCEQPGAAGTGFPIENGTGNGPGSGSGGGNGDEDDDEEEAAVVTGITLLSLPDTTIYGRDAVFDPAGLAVAWTWSDGGTTEIPAGAYTLSQPDMAKYSPQMLTVSAGAYSTTFSINVMDSAKILQSLSVSGPANKVNRFGSDFDKTGLVVTGYYSNNTTGNVTPYATITGYDKRIRGEQNVSVKVNGKTAPIPGVSIRIPAGTAVTLMTNQYSKPGGSGYRRVYLKGESLEMSSANFHGTVATAVGTISLSYALGNIVDGDYVTGFDPDTPGKQQAVLHLDEAETAFDVSVVDLAPDVWFDYGYRRDPDDPNGKGPGAGKYYARPNETLVLSPVRFLVGYGRDHKDTGVTYSWSASGGSFSSPASASGEFYSVTPTAAGTTTVTVQVTGQSYITGQPVTKTATTDVVCHEGTVPAGAAAWGLGQKLLQPGPGQYAVAGSGYGWSLGSFGGYEVWRVNHKNIYTISGNAFAGWDEPGTVWIQEDRNGNGIPDEMWYELKGSQDYVTNGLNRRYAVTYIDTSVETSTIGSKLIYFVDARGRAGTWLSQWHTSWPPRITFTGTLLGDSGGKVPDEMCSGLWGYVDVSGPSSGHGPAGDIHKPNEFPIHRAIRANGSSVALTDVRFIKVSTAVFTNTSYFNDKSTEIYSADFLGKQTDFPLPEDSY